MPLNNPDNPVKKVPLVIEKKVIVREPFTFKGYFDRLVKEWKQKAYSRQVDQGKVPHGRSNIELTGTTQIKRR